MEDFLSDPVGGGIFLLFVIVWTIAFYSWGYQAGYNNIWNKDGSLKKP